MIASGISHRTSFIPMPLGNSAPREDFDWTAFLSSATVRKRIFALLQSRDESDVHAVGEMKSTSDHQHIMTSVGVSVHNESVALQQLLEDGRNYEVDRILLEAFGTSASLPSSSSTPSAYIRNPPPTSPAPTPMCHSGRLAAPYVENKDPFVWAHLVSSHLTSYQHTSIVALSSRSMPTPARHGLGPDW